MAKAIKTWKLGEVCQGGVITVEINGKVISIIGKEWDTSAGYKKSSNQSNAKEFTRGTIISNDKESRFKCFMFLTDLTTAYWADEILNWIETKVELNKELYC
jgi:hypothetical protein